MTWRKYSRWQKETINMKRKSLLSSGVTTKSLTATNQNLNFDSNVNHSRLNQEIQGLVECLPAALRSIVENRLENIKQRTKTIMSFIDQNISH